MIILRKILQRLLFFQRPLETPDEQGSQSTTQSSSSGSNSSQSNHLPSLHGLTNPNASLLDANNWKLDQMLISPMRASHNSVFHDSAIQLSNQTQPNNPTLIVHNSDLARSHLVGIANGRLKERQSYTEGVRPNNDVNIESFPAVSFETCKIPTDSFGLESSSGLSVMRPGVVGLGQNNRASLIDSRHLLVDYLPSAHLAQLRAYANNVK